MPYIYLNLINSTHLRKPPSFEQRFQFQSNVTMHILVQDCWDKLKQNNFQNEIQV